MVDPDTLTGYDPAEDAVPGLNATLGRDVATLMERLRTAERPVIYAGAGVRLAGAVAELLAFPAGRHDDQVDSISQALTWIRDRRRAPQFACV